MIEGKEFLSASEREYYDALEMVFESKGWEIIMGRLRDEISTLPERAFQHCKDYEELQTARARYAALLGVMTLPNEIAVEAESIVQAREREQGGE